MRTVLDSPDEMNFRVYEIPLSGIRKNDKKIKYFDFLTSLQYEGCNEALKRIAPRFKMEEIKKLIDGIPYTTELQREFYKQILMLRKEKIIDYSLSKLQEQERKKQRPNMDFKAKKRTKNPLER